MAKEALAEVTVQAAEKAATGVKELAERSTRIALKVHFNAPVIFVPQSSSSTNVIVADLGQLSVKNCFSKQPFQSNAGIPPVVDIMTVKLTDLKMYRLEFSYFCVLKSDKINRIEIFFLISASFECCVVTAPRTTYLKNKQKFQGEIQLLMPVNLDLKIMRNLSSNWYHSIPDIEISAHLKPMTVSFWVWWFDKDRYLIVLSIYF